MKEGDTEMGIGKEEKREKEGCRGETMILDTSVTIYKLWNSLPESIFPPSYDLNSFKGGVSRHLQP